MRSRGIVPGPLERVRPSGHFRSPALAVALETPPLPASRSIGALFSSGPFPKAAFADAAVGSLGDAVRSRACPTSEQSVHVHVPVLQHLSPQSPQRVPPPPPPPPLHRRLRCRYRQSMSPHTQGSRGCQHHSRPPLDRSLGRYTNCTRIRCCRSSRCHTDRCRCCSMYGSRTSCCSSRRGTRTSARR
jgi:hypothetical protein